MPAIACCVMHWLGLGLGQSAGGTQVERTADRGVGLAPCRPEVRLFSARPRHPARPENLLPSPVPVRLRHPELADRLALEVEFDQDCSLITDNPAIMAGLDDDDLRSRELDSAAVRILDVDLAAGQEPDVRVHAEVGADDRFHVFWFRGRSNPVPLWRSAGGETINPAAQFFSTRALQRSTPHQISGMPDREIPSCGTADVSVFLLTRDGANSRIPLVSFCRETRAPRARPLPHGRGSDGKSRIINDAIRAPTVREGLLHSRTPVSRQKRVSPQGASSARYSRRRLLRTAVPDRDFQSEIVEADARQQLYAVAGFAGGADGGQGNARAGFADAHRVVHARVVGEEFGGAQGAGIGQQDGEALAWGGGGRP